MLRLDIINSRIIQLPVSEVDLIGLSTVFDTLKDGLNMYVVKINETPLSKN